MRVVAYFVAGLLAAGAIVVIGAQIVANSHRSDPGVVVIEPPVQTPLPRDSGPKNNQRRHARGRNGKVVTVRGGNRQVRHNARPQNRPQTVKTRRTPRPKARKRPAPHSGSQPSPATNPQPAPQKQCPPVNVPVPVPLTVTTPVAGVNC